MKQTYQNRNSIFLKQLNWRQLGKFLLPFRHDERQSLCAEITRRRQRAQPVLRTAVREAQNVYIQRYLAHVMCDNASVLHLPALWEPHQSTHRGADAAAALRLRHESLGPPSDLLGRYVFLVGGDPPLIAHRVLDASATVPVELVRWLTRRGRAGL